MNRIITARSIAEQYPSHVSTGKDERINCPAHGGDNPDLAIWDTPTFIGVKCWTADCSVDSLLAALGVDKPTKNPNPWRTPSPTATYAHPDGKSRSAYRVNYPDHFDDHLAPCSYGRETMCGKTEPHKHPYSTRGVSKRGTYMLKWSPDVRDHTLVIVEGEKAALALKGYMSGVKVTPVSWFGGKDAWRVTSLLFDMDENLDGRDVVLWPDAGTKGIEAMRNLARRISREAHVRTLKIVETSSLSDGNDAYDVTKEQSLAFISTATEYEDEDAHIAPLLGTATETDLGGGDSVQKLRDAVMRRACQVVASRYINLFGFWYQRVGSAWLDVEEDYIARDISYATIRESGYALDKRFKMASTDRLRDVVSPPANNLSVLPSHQRQMSFHMDTGEIVEGVVYGDAVISIDDDGHIQRAPINERHFIQSIIRYVLPTALVDTPMFDQYMATSLRTDEDRQLLMELLGRTLSGRRSDHVIAMLYGIGGSGKGTFLELMEFLLDGNIGSATSFDRVAERFGTAKMRRLLAYTFNDLPPMPARNAAKGFMDGAHVIKNISGGDPVDVEVKGDPRAYSMRLPCAIWIATNFAPKWMDGVEDAEAWRRRIAPVVFNDPIPKEQQIDNLAMNIFQQEGPHVALKCIQAYSNAKQRGQWPMLTETSHRYLMQWIDTAKGEQSVFARENIIVTGIREDTISNLELRSAYAEYIGETDIHHNSKEAKALTDVMQHELGAESDRWNGAGKNGTVGRGYRGVRFRRIEDNDGDAPEQVPLVGSICRECGETDPNLVYNGLCEACKYFGETDAG